jgi:hypothetical protein
VLYLAGHEVGSFSQHGEPTDLASRKTSGHTLSFALNMLAVHQEEQEILYQHIQDILPNRRQPVRSKLLPAQLKLIVS